MPGRGGGNRIGMRNAEAIRQTYNAASRLVRLRGDGFLNHRGVMNGSKLHSDPEGRSGGLDCAVEQCGEGSVRVEDDGDPGDTRARPP